MALASPSNSDSSKSCDALCASPVYWNSADGSILARKKRLKTAAEQAPSKQRSWKNTRTFIGKTFRSIASRWPKQGKTSPARNVPSLSAWARQLRHDGDSGKKRNTPPLCLTQYLKCIRRSMQHFGSGLRRAISLERS